MENQINETKPLNVKGLILLIGVVFGALIALAAYGTVLSTLGGVIGGLIFAAIFIAYLLPHKPHDR